MRFKRRVVTVAIALAERAARMLEGHMQRSGMMLAALPFEVAKIEDVAEAQRPLYKQAGDKFVLDVDGLDGDPKGFKSALEAERRRAKAAEDKQREVEGKLVGVDLEAYRKWQTDMETDEEKRLIRDGKLDEVFERRTEKLRKQHADELDAERGNTKTSKDRVEKITQRALAGSVITAGKDAGAHSKALDDALLNAHAEGWTVDDNGDAVQLDKDGEVVMGPSGNKPFTLTEWFAEKKETKPHWFPSTNSGGGAGGDRGAGGKGKDLSGLSPVERMTQARAAR